MHLRRCASIALATGLSVTADGCIAPQRPAGTVVYASGTDLESGNPLVTVHPLSRQVQRYVLYVTLAQYDSNLVIVPYGASGWRWSDDRRRLTLDLVPQLRWQDGMRTTAHDVAFTIAAARDPATGYARAADLAPIDSTIVRDDSTIILEFRRPQPVFPPVLCELPIVPEHLLAPISHREMRRAAFNDHPVGNGPFTFVSRDAGQRWVFRRNGAFPRALGGPPRLDGLVVAVVDEPTTKFAGLASGDLDVAGIAPTMAFLVRGDASLRVLDYPILFSTALVFNIHRPPFDDRRVRRAIDLSVDRDRIVRAALAGYGRPAGGPVSAASPLAIATQPRLDGRSADSLLDAAGWRRGADGVRARNGRLLIFELLTVGSGDNAVEQLIQADLAARGVGVDIRQVEMGTFLSVARATPKRFDVLLAGIPGDLSLAYVVAMFDSRQAGGALDYADYHTPVLDSLFGRVRAAVSPAELRAAWASVQERLVSDVPVSWLYEARGLQGVSTRLSHVRMDVRGELATIAQWEVAATGRGRSR